MRFSGPEASVRSVPKVRGGKDGKDDDARATNGTHGLGGYSTLLDVVVGSAERLISFVVMGGTESESGRCLVPCIGARIQLSKAKKLVQ